MKNVCAVKPFIRDTVAGTGKIWQRDEVIPVPVEVATVLLLHPDMWADVTDEYQPEADDLEIAQLKARIAELEAEGIALRAQLAQYAPEQQDSEIEPDILAPPQDLNGMTKAELVSFAQRELHISLSAEAKKADLLHTIETTIASARAA